MNDKLIKLYLQIEKELDEASPYKAHELEDLYTAVVDKNTKNNNPLINHLVQEVLDKRINPIIEESKKEVKGMDERQREVLLMLKEILEEKITDIEKVKQLKEEMQIKKLLKEYVRAKTGTDTINHE